MKAAVRPLRIFLSDQPGKAQEVIGHLLRKRPGRKPESSSSRFDTRYSDEQLKGAGDEQFIGVGQFRQTNVSFTGGNAEFPEFP